MQLQIVFTVILVVMFYGNKEMNVAAENATEPDEVNVNDRPTKLDDFILQMSRKKCFQNLSSSCLKIALVSLMGHLTKGECKLLPGLTLVSSVKELTRHFGKDSTSNSKVSYSFTLQHIKNWFQSLINKVKLQDYKVFKKIKLLQDDIEDVLVPGIISGRGKKGNALLYTAGTLAAVGFAALAAVAGKALMASLLALMLSVLGAMKGGGGHGKHAHYEIITKPHSAHYQASAPAHYYTNDHYNTAPSYDYARTMRIETLHERSPTGVVEEVSAAPHEDYLNQHKYKITTYKPQLD